MRRLRYRCGDRLEVPPVRGPPLTRDRSSAAAAALATLSLCAQHAPEAARGRFLDVLRAQGLAEPYDPAAGPGLVRAWRRPDIYVRAFVGHVLDALGGPERVAALEAIATLGERPARRSRAAAAAAAGRAGDGPGGGGAL
jgi:hypothetical protein